MLFPMCFERGIFICVFIVGIVAEILMLVLLRHASRTQCTRNLLHNGLRFTELGVSQDPLLKDEGSIDESLYMPVFLSMRSACDQKLLPSDGC